MTFSDLEKHCGGFASIGEGPNEDRRYVCAREATLSVCNSLPHSFFLAVEALSYWVVLEGVFTSALLRSRCISRPLGGLEYIQKTRGETHRHIFFQSTGKHKHSSLAMKQFGPPRIYVNGPWGVRKSTQFSVCTCRHCVRTLGWLFLGRVPFEHVEGSRV